jgi:general secretion pathway protein F
MASSSAPRAPSITLEQLVALNEEIAGLVRVGVPLEHGLRQLGEDLPGRAGSAAAFLASQLEQGLSLEQVLAENPAFFPPIYRAVVEAGIRTGSLASALEAIAGSARRLAETRRLVAISLVYPVFVFLLAWGFFLVFVWNLQGSILRFMEDMDRPTAAMKVIESLLLYLNGWRDSMHVWGPIVPAVVLSVVGFWWFRSRKASLVEPSGADRLFGWFPWLRGMLRQSRAATFADVLSLLVEHGVPLDRALVLAAECSGTQSMVRAAESMAAAVRRGEPLDRLAVSRKDFPPLMNWLMLAGYRQGTMAKTLRHAAEVYRQRAIQLAEVARLFVPILLTLSIGGVALVVYAAIVLSGWITVLQTLAQGV